jgi:uncharacterized membrane protein
MLNPFDLKSALLAKHAQHVVLIHFPIGLYLAGTFFDLCARLVRKNSLGEVTRWNILAAAIVSLPTAVTGLLAWRWALEGQTLKGLLKLHLILACAVIVGTWATVWLRSRSKTGAGGAGFPSLLILECSVSLLIGLTAHIGGFLSGVNI